MRKLALLIGSVILFGAWGRAQQVIVAPSVPTAGSITVSANPSNIPIGGKATLTAQLFSTTGLPNNYITYTCAWTSSNPAILSVSGNVATGVSAGSATANCTLGTITGSIPVSINVSTITFTNPLQSSCANPCLLPNVSSGNAYSFTFAATSSAGGPYSWTCTVTCSSVLPSGITLSSGGVLSGTTSSTGTYLFTVQVTDGGSNTATQPVSLTVNSASSCSGNFGGPPNYGCASSSTQNPGLISAIMSSTSYSGVVSVTTTTSGSCTPTSAQNCMLYTSGDNFSTSWASGNGPGSGGNILVNGNKCEAVTWYSTTLAKIQCSSQLSAASGLGWSNFTACKGVSSNGTGNGCQNSTAYDTTIPGYISGSGCITRITDPGSTTGQGYSVGNFSKSGAGTTDIISLPFNSGLDHYIAVSMYGGTSYIYHLTTTAGCVQVVNTGQPAIQVQGTVLFSHVPATYNVFYYMGGNTNGGTYGTQVNKCTIVSDSVTTCAALFDFFAGGGSVSGPPCPGVTPFTTVSGPGISGLSTNDDEFGAYWSAGIQNTGYWVFAYSLSAQGGGHPSCSSLNLVTGQGWAFCTSSCGPSTAPIINSATGLATLQGNVSTTTTKSVSAGVTSVAVASTAQMFLGQSVLVDTSGSGVQETVTVTGYISSGFTFCTAGVVAPCFFATFANAHASGVPVAYTAPTCWGAPGGSSNSNIHDEIFGWGGYMHFGIEGSTSWSQGTCAVVSNSDQEMIWQPGSLTETYMNASLTYYAGVTHDSMGVSNQIGVNFNGADIRAFTSLTTPTFLSAIPPFNDSHTSGWAHDCAGTGTTPNDTCLWISASDTALSSQTTAGTGNCPAGTSTVYCPPYLVNVIFGYSPSSTYPPGTPPLIFAHTYGNGVAGSTYAHTSDGIADPFGPGNTISAESPDGTLVCWVTTMLHAWGKDGSGVPVASAVCMRL